MSRPALLLAAALALLAAAPAQAAGPLVSGELRLGQDPGSAPVSTPFVVRQLDELCFRWAGGSVTCPVGGGAESTLNGDASSLFWTNPAFGCSSDVPGGPTAVVGQGGGARVRFERNRPPRGRDGVIDRDPRFDKWQFDLFFYDGPAYLGSCSYRFDFGVRLDVFNPGRGHRIAYHDEPLYYLEPKGGASDLGSCPADTDPDTPDATLTEDVRLRFQEPGGGAFSLPAWVQPL